MKNRWWVYAFLFTWLIATPLPGLAQTTGAGLAGTVRDPSGAVLPGVTVEASSPALIEKVRVVVTDSAGQYSITELRPGRYTVTFSLVGFTTVRREGIDLVTGFTGNVNAELPVGSLEESITVTGASPVVDVQNTRQQVAITRELIEAVPTGKQYQQIANMIPSIIVTTNDVGGLQGQRYPGLSIHGSRPHDSGLEIDGAPLQGWQNPAQTTAMYSDGAYQEFVLDVSGASAETESGGVRTNLIPRDGGNIFSGGLVASASHPKLQFKNITPELRAKGVRDPHTLKRLWTVNPNVGGPLRKDRVWFFLNYARMVADQYVANSYLNACLGCWEYTPDLTRQAVDDEVGRDVSLRLTWQATARHKFTAFVDDNYHCNCHFGLGGVGQGGNLLDRAEATRYSLSDLHILQGGWTFPATQRLLAQASVTSAPHEPQGFFDHPEVVAPRIEDAGLGINYRAFGSPTIAYMEMVTSRAAVSYVTGSHSAKAGALVTTGGQRREYVTFGALRYGALNGVPTSVTYHRTPYETSYHIRPVLGLYAQDQWTVKNLTLNAGLRFDYFRATQPAQTVTASGYVRESVSVPFLLGVAWKDLNPRVGVSYDLFGNGKTALKGTLNRYVLRMGINEIIRVSALDANSSNTRTWSDVNGDRVVQGDPFNHAANGELGPSQNLAFGQLESSRRYDPDFSTGFGTRPMNWEVSGGIQHELRPGVSAEAILTRRIFGNFPLFENLAAPASAWDQYCVTAPVDARLPNGGGHQLCGIYDLKPAFVGQQDELGTRANAYGTQQEHFTAIDVNVNARLRGVTLQSGLSSGKLMTDNCEIVKRVPSAVVAAAGVFCHVETPFLTQVKVSGAYVLPWQDIQISGVYQNLPGPEILANAQFTSAQVAPALGRPLSRGRVVAVPLVAPGTLYDERMQQVDLRLAKTVSVGPTRIQGQFDLYNLFNASPIRAYSGVYGATTGPATGSAYLIPGVVLPARLIKIGMQLTF